MTTVTTMRKYGFLVVLAAAAALSACGGNSGTSSFGSSSSGGTTSSSGASSSGGTQSTYSLGNGSGSSFQSGMIGLSATTLAAGGTASLDVSVVDQTGTLYTGAAVTIAFNSACIAQGLAVIAASGSTVAGTNANTVVTSTGSASVTYTAKGCSGPDVISATAAVVSQNLTATGTISVAPASIGSLQFQSATPTTIGLKGTGLGETSTVVFQVVDQTGAPRPGVLVTFSLNTSVGGITLTPASATSAADGTVQTVVSSGTQHTSVRVTATIATPALSTQSSVLTVTTGLPASAGFSIAVGKPSYPNAPACPNVEAFSTDGVVVPVTVRLSDRYNNPAPDGTAVAFTTDGGHVVGSCATPSAPGAADGTCSVNWTSANPRPVPGDDSPPILAPGRAAILATAIGEESFTDLNGNGYWDPGEPFVNLGEPYRDDNENGMYDPVEYFLDFNQNGVRDPGDGTFKGITCSGSTCSTSTLAIGAQLLIIMSTGTAQITLQSTTGFTGTSPLQITHGTGGSLTYNVKDLNNNPMAAGTTIAVTADAGIGTISTSTASFVIGCRSALGGETLSAGLTAGSAAGGGNISIAVTSPGSTEITTLLIPVQVN